MQSSCAFYTRRLFLQALAAVSAPLPAAFAMKPVLRRDYRADAVILLFSLPIYTREGVGGGFAAARLQDESGQTIESLQFAAGSDPERARGLNRLGFIQETVKSEGGTPAESIYTGFMTASDEQSFAQAKSALENNKERLQYQGIEGQIQSGAARSRSVRFETPAAWNWTRFEELYPFAEQMIRQAAPKGKEVVLQARSATRSFLSAMMQTIRDPAEKTECTFVYGGGEHTLIAEKRSDEKVAKRLAARGLTRFPERIIAVHGRLQELRGSRGSKFRIWFEKGSDNPLPLRIEFQPKAFLALAFEAKTA
jgi:hypothetical protein